MMTFPMPCRSCGRSNDVEWSRIGQKVSCAGCGTTSTVSAPRETVNAGDSPEPTPMVRFACPSCGRKFATKAELAGKKVRCNGCGAGVRVPQGDDASVLARSKPMLKTFGAPDPVMAPPRSTRDQSARAEVRSAPAIEVGDPTSLLDEIASIEGMKRPRRAESILPSRSEMMEQVREKVAEQEAVETEKKVEKARKKKKRKKHSGYFDPKETLTLVAGVAAVVGMLTFLAWGYPDFRFPLGGLLVVIGFIVYLLGGAALRQLVAEEAPSS